MLKACCDPPKEYPVKFGITYSFEKGAGRSATDRFHEAVEEIRLAETLGYDCAFVS